MLGELIKWSGFVKLSHTVFALPFALASMSLAARETRGWPGWRLFLLIVGAVITARTCAMSFNRIVDRRFDKENPRTAQRHLPTGEISLASAWTLCLASAIGFLVISHAINFVCFVLSPLALLVVCFYSLTKRFTDFTHIYLGVALSLAPIGAWLAVRGTLHLAPIVLALAVVCWLIGFDIIYALQDYDFDRTHRLHSLVVRWGPKNALQFSFLIHMLMWGLLAIFGLFSRFWLPYFVALGIILVSLLLEHLLARRRSLKWINIAFFRLNALVSLVFLTGTVVSVAFPWFRPPAALKIPFWM
ncbi:MAG TPA: 4-hydroxybenzoate octaprenyltransferase [Verrucomicrobiae bacterium]|nr:4-hydroxybenzoate octaprenyltransferase [Verrucomicrobiae bacterium]